MNFNVASQSIDRLWATARANDAVNGYNLAVAPPKAVEDAGDHYVSEESTAAPF
eukprot:SAG11_NODE_41008_length_199_cov_12.410000_1_plen_53_part_01